MSTSLSRAGEYSLMYVGELAGIVMMFWGFQMAGAKRPAPTGPRPAHSKAKAAAGALAVK
jgi:hypothetical protein